MLSIFCFASCSTKLNQFKEGKKQGKWITKTADGEVYKERFKNGQEVGTWKQINQGKLFKKERYKRNESYLTFYHPNKKVMSTGKTKMDSTDEMIHWYYTGKWLYYNDKGDLIETRLYDKGIPKEEEIIP